MKESEKYSTIVFFERDNGHSTRVKSSFWEKLEKLIAESNSMLALNLISKEEEALWGVVDWSSTLMISPLILNYIISNMLVAALWPKRLTIEYLLYYVFI